MLFDEARKSELESLGGSAFFLEMLDKFLVQSREIVTELRTHLASSNGEKIKALLHKLKGSSLTIGSADVSEAVIHAYENAKATTMSPAELDAIDRALTELEAHRKNLK